MQASEMEEWGEQRQCWQMKKALDWVTCLPKVESSVYVYWHCTKRIEQAQPWLYNYNTLAVNSSQTGG